MLLINEYFLDLHNGERIKIHEYNASNNPEYDLDRLRDPILNKIPKIPEHILEDSKKGNTYEFVKYLRGSPLSAIANVKERDCRSKNSCVSYNKSCSLIFPIYKLPDLPQCFEYNESNEWLRMLMTEAIKAWESGGILVMIHDSFKDCMKS